MTRGDGDWDRLEGRPPESVVVGDRELRRGSRVRLRPRGRGDVIDHSLAGRTGCIESIEQTESGEIHLAIVLDDDPGRDLGRGRFPGHRFFFSTAEVESIDGEVGAPPRRLLVAGIGNVFLGDDGFGVEVARVLAGRALPPGVLVADFGIRGLDLVYALLDGHDGVILVDAMPRGEAPGTLVVLAPEIPGDPRAPLEAHGMDPARVLAFARQLGPIPGETVVVGCEPAALEATMELSEPVRSAVPRAADLIASLAGTFLERGTFEPRDGGDAS